MYLALARRYRPRLFADLVAQEHVARALRGAVEQGKVAHGYLFAGPRGVGKTTAARILAMALNCEARHAGRPTAAPGEPCGECPSCARIWAGSASLDVVEIDAASNRGVDDARDLRERAMYAASQEGRHKVYIVDEAHMLTRDAWNALLKILEEPPAGVVFVFATTEPHKITNTAAPVMSRLQRFDFRRVGPQAIADHVRSVLVREGLTADDDAVEIIARVADGGLRDALSVLDQATAFGEGTLTAARVRQVLGLVGDELYAEALDMVAEHRAADVFPFVAKLVEAGLDLTAFTDGAGDVLRALLAVRLGGRPEGVSSALAAQVSRIAPALEPGDLLRMLHVLEEAEEPIRRGAHARLAVETMLVRWCLMDRTVEIAELLRGESAGKLPDGKVRAVTRASEGGGQSPAPASSRPATMRDPAAPAVRESAAPAASAPTPAPAPAPPRASAPGGPLTLEAVRGAWADVVAAARAEKPMLASALEDAEPVACDGTAVRIRARGGNPMTGEGLSRGRPSIEAIVGRVLGTPVRVVAAEASGGPPRAQAGSPGGSAGPGAPSGTVRESPVRPTAQRVTATGAKAERLQALRGKDPTLDSAIDSLDLELLE
ncbi:MAG TPA: DNA polymerase III subunit gamma/tau [Gemmatimonadales bacterium]|nr:DNA polymerase III subunit gamma/tau [Gemmatimonadales bacterium]